MADEQMRVATPRVAAGVIVTDDQARVLMLRPTYKDYWDLPGGYVEPGESPHSAAVRETAEELGVTMAVGEMLAVDWAPSDQEGDKLLFLFAGQLAGNATLSFTDGEIDEARYVGVDELEQYTIDRLARRIRSAVHAPAAAYLERGQPMTATSV